MTYRDTIRETMRAEMLRDERVVLLGEEISDPFGGPFKTEAGLQTQFGRERVRETPISETAIMGTCLGLALGGMRPIADMLLCDFTLTGMDQIVNQIA
jgi:pyruvate/2-oxoglutarate/acetoin dehydrogenase E1 component